MPIYEYHCKRCGAVFEKIRPMSESDDTYPCTHCATPSARIQSVPVIRMDRIYDNAEFGPRAFFGEDLAGHENWQEVAEESEMVTKKRDELEKKGKLNDFVFEEGEYATEPGQDAKTIEEV